MRRTAASSWTCSVCGSTACGRSERPGPDREPGRTGSPPTCSTSDRYGAYPVRSLICHGTYWKRAIALLLERSDLVVLDLSGYLPRNDGTRYELQRLVDTVPFERVVLVADPRSSKRFLREELARAWKSMADGSPNAGTGIATVEIAIIDYYHQFERRNSAGTTEQSRLTLLSSARAMLPA